MYVHGLIAKYGSFNSLDDYLGIGRQIKLQQRKFFHWDMLPTQMCAARLDWDIYWYYLRSIYIYAKLGRTHD